MTTKTWEAYQSGRAALQSQSKSDLTLFCDLKTDEEKSAFFLSGRGYETGVIAHSIQNDVAMAYHRCSEYRNELEALQAECEKLRADNSELRAKLEAPINVSYIDGNGAARRRPEDCRHGVSYVTVADTVYWPLSADDAQRLRSAECGNGDFTGPANECPDVSALVEALERIAAWPDGGSQYGQRNIKIFAAEAIAAHRKQGGEV